MAPRKRQQSTNTTSSLQPPKRRRISTPAVSLVTNGSTLNTLPVEITENIISNLDARDVLSLRATCKTLLSESFRFWHHRFSSITTDLSHRNLKAHIELWRKSPSSFSFDTLLVERFCPYRNHQARPRVHRDYQTRPRLGRGFRWKYCRNKTGGLGEVADTNVCIDMLSELLSMLPNCKTFRVTTEGYVAPKQRKDSISVCDAICVLLKVFSKSPVVADELHLFGYLPGSLSGLVLFPNKLPDYVITDARLVTFWSNLKVLTLTCPHSWLVVGENGFPLTYECLLLAATNITSLSMDLSISAQETDDFIKRITSSATGLQNVQTLSLSLNVTAQGLGTLLTFFGSSVTCLKLGRLGLWTGGDQQWVHVLENFGTWLPCIQSISIQRLVWLDDPWFHRKVTFPTCLKDGRAVCPGNQAQNSRAFAISYKGADVDAVCRELATSALISKKDRGIRMVRHR